MFWNSFLSWIPTYSWAKEDIESVCHNLSIIGVVTQTCEQLQTPLVALLYLEMLFLCPFGGQIHSWCHCILGSAQITVTVTRVSK